MECMAIGGSSNNPLLANLFTNNSTSGLAQKNQTEKASSTETDTSSDTAKSSAERIAELRAKATDGFGTVDFNTLARTKAPAASPIASTEINFNQNIGITATSALGEPSSVTAINDPKVVAATTNDNAQLKLETTLLASLANRSNARTVDGDFNVSEANTSLANDHDILARVAKNA